MPLFIAPIDVELKVAKILVDEKTKKHLLNLGVNVGSTIKVISNSQKDVIVMKIIVAA